MSIVLFIPGSVLALCGGALFKWHWGTLLVWVGQSIGQVIAFVIGRYLLRDAVVANVTTRYPKFAAIDAALEREGWRLVVMMRLSPLVPWNVLNYLLSITGTCAGRCYTTCTPPTAGVSFVSYSLASCASVLPWLSLFTYLGSMATTAADVLSGQAAPAGQTRVAVAAASGVLLVAAVVYTGVVAKYVVCASMFTWAYTGQPTGGRLQTCLGPFLGAYWMPRSNSHVWSWWDHPRLGTLPTCAVLRQRKPFLAICFSILDRYLCVSYRKY